LKGTTNELLKQKRIQESNAGSSKKFFGAKQRIWRKGICSVSKKFQDLKLDELESKKETLTAEMFENAKTKITEKSCLCVGLANASYLENDMKIKGQAQGVVICPDPIWLILIKKYRFLKWCSIFRMLRY
jgi:hypothetical protein